MKPKEIIPRNTVSIIHFRGTNTYQILIDDKDFLETDFAPYANNFYNKLLASLKNNLEKGENLKYGIILHKNTYGETFVVENRCTIIRENDNV